MTAGNVLITGATGFVGSHLARRLVDRGEKVHVVARTTSSLWRLKAISSQICIWRGDLTDPTFVDLCLAAVRPATVFHFAAATDSRLMDPSLLQIERSIDLNLKSTMHLLRGLHLGGFPVHCFVRSGGLEEYGRGSQPSSEEQREQPLSPYSASQVAATHYCQMVQGYVRFPIVTIRPALIYGPAQSTTFFIPSLITHCLRGKDFEMTSGQQSRDLLFIDDAVEAFVAASRTDGIAGQVINIGSGREARVLDVARSIVELTGARIQLGIGAYATRSSEVDHMVCSNEKANRLMGWHPHTELSHGLSQTIAWYREEHCMNQSTKQVAEAV